MGVPNPPEAGLLVEVGTGADSAQCFQLTGGAATAQWRAMAHPALEALLILQDRDSKRLGVEVQLKSVPHDIAAVEQRIATEREALDASRAELKDLEVRKKALETDIGVAEEKIAQYRTQQLAIRKNDEYQAMGHQIETVQGQIGELEGREIELLYAIDEAKGRYSAAEAEMKANISGHEARIRMLREREASLGAELKVMQAEVAAARAPVDERWLRLYDRIATLNHPVIVPIVAGKCGGCHLKVSSEVESATRSKGVDPTAAPATCDQCGRIVYWEQ